jgi:aspartate racemase
VGDQDRVNEVIYKELCAGNVLPRSRRMFLDVIERLRSNGAQGVVLGCTEIPLLVQPQDCPLPIFNITLLHAEKALCYAVQT